MRVFHSAGKKVYFTLLASSFMFPISAFAQCVDTQDCQTLGYTETSDSGNCVKCFFGEYWFCPEPEEEKAVLGQCTGYAKNCKIADILYTDGTCSADVVSGKTPIAVVVYIGGDGCGQALALEGLGNFYWSTEFVHIPDLFHSSNEPVNDFSSCENTKIVIDYSYNQYGDRASEIYPAFWKAYNYAPAAIPETKGKWCLPAGGVLNSLYQNKTAIDQSLTRINQENIGSAYWWTSSESSYITAWRWIASSGDFRSSNKCFNEYGIYSHYVRPVLAF